MKIFNKVKQPKEEKPVKEQKVYTKEEVYKKISGYLTAGISILTTAFLIVYAILWVTISKNATTANGISNVEIKLLYGGMVELIIGLVFFILGVLLYAANTKKMKAIKWILSVTFTLIGVLLINSLPGLIIGLFIVLFEVLRMVLNFNKFKENIFEVKEKFTQLTKKKEYHESTTD